MRHWTVLIALLPALAIAEAPVPGPREVLALDEAMHPEVPHFAPEFRASEPVAG